jgi:hypothetical protein
MVGTRYLLKWSTVVHGKITVPERRGRQSSLSDEFLFTSLYVNDGCELRKILCVPGMHERTIKILVECSELKTRGRSTAAPLSGSTYMLYKLRMSEQRNMEAPVVSPLALDSALSDCVSPRRCISDGLRDTLSHDNATSF